MHLRQNTGRRYIAREGGHAGRASRGNERRSGEDAGARVADRAPGDRRPPRTAGRPDAVGRATDKVVTDGEAGVVGRLHAQRHRERLLPTQNILNNRIFDPWQALFAEDGPRRPKRPQSAAGEAARIEALRRSPGSPAAIRSTGVPSPGNRPPAAPWTAPARSRASGKRKALPPRRGGAQDGGGLLRRARRATSTPIVHRPGGFIGREGRPGGDRPAPPR